MAPRHRGFPHASAPGSVIEFRFAPEPRAPGSALARRREPRMSSAAWTLRPLIAAALLCLSLAASPARAQIPGTAPSPERPPEDFIRGYAAAVLEREFGIRDARIGLKEGTITIRVRPLPPEERSRLLRALRSLPGIERAEVVEEHAAPLPPLAAPAAARHEFLPRSDLFAPLIADPRWPHFSLGYQFYFNDQAFQNVFAPSFGETIPFYRLPTPAGPVQFGVHAAVFPIFDLDADSFDLINADYWVAGAAEYKRGPYSALFRIFHQSSHLGDEFLLRTRRDEINRVNLSYEAAGLLLSREFFERALRLYAGAEYIFHRDPRRLKPWTLQYGAELYSPVTYFGGWLRPVAGLDIKNAQEAGWDANLSLRAGVQVEPPREPSEVLSGLRERRIQFMLEFFTGRSPNGQFYDETFKYLGVGMHLYF